MLKSHLWYFAMAVPVDYKKWFPVTDISCYLLHSRKIPSKTFIWFISLPWPGWVWSSSSRTWKETEEEIVRKDLTQSLHCPQFLTDQSQAGRKQKLHTRWQIKGFKKVEGEWKRWRWGNMVDGLHIHIWNRTMKPFAIALSGAESRLWKGRKRKKNVLWFYFRSFLYDL
jgi:hypothetical protein